MARAPKKDTGKSPRPKRGPDKKYCVKLITLDQFRIMTPRQQGYASYMQGELIGSPLKRHQKNPYPLGSREHEEFATGQMTGVLAVQDSED